MRYKFLLDENILHHAIRGVDRFNQPDLTSARLILTIVRVCHSLVVHDVLRIVYIKTLNALKDIRPSHLELTFFFRQVMNRSEKRSFEYAEMPDLPTDCEDIPRKDRYLIQAALISRPLFVTADEALYDSIKRHPELGLEVFWPHEALERAKEIP